MNGVAGVLVTSKLEGYTSKYIFIPGTNNHDTSLSSGRYWTASLKDTGHHETPDLQRLSVCPHAFHPALSYSRIPAVLH